MFGNPIRVEFDGLGVTLRPPTKEEAEALALLFSSHIVQRYTMMDHALTTADEGEWWEKTRKEPDSMLWAIVPDGNNDVPVGNTALHNIHPTWGGCTAGLVIADRAWWGKGVAYRANVAHTWFAATSLNRYTVQASVRTVNRYSFKSLLKVGYRISGQEDRNVFVDNAFLDTYVMSWVNPFKTGLLYPEGVPTELERSLAKAEETLELADKVVRFL